MGLFKPNIKKMKAKGDVEGLIEALEHKDWRVQWDAAEALGDVGDARAVEPLIQALERAYLVESKLQDDERIQVVATDLDRRLGLGHGMVVIGGVAVPALVKIGEAAVEPLIEALSDEVFIVRAGAAVALGKIGDARAVEPLIRTMKKDKNEDVREAAKEALEKTKAKEG